MVLPALTPIRSAPPTLRSTSKPLLAADARGGIKSPPKRWPSLFSGLKKKNKTHGKIRTPEQIKFTKEALALVWPYFLPPYTFQIRVGALYLLYGLYNTQLCQPKEKIRVALKDWAEVSKFKQELLDAQHYDAAYIFRKLRMDKAFYFTAMPKFLSFRTKKNMHTNTEMKREFRDPTDRVAMLCHENFLEETKNIHEHYKKMKCLISMDQSQPNKAISLIKDDFAAKFQDIILDYQQWQKKKMGSGRAKTLAEIKSRSYSAVAQVSINPHSFFTRFLEVVCHCFLPIAKRK
uniref:Small nuclear RNA activating complex polypeptide 1 n=1 Tax=Laticauda laticaudata TaxID=8630 RepID=A0A8C5SZB5_LATLA